MLIIKDYFIVSIVNYTEISMVTHNTLQVYLKDLFSAFKVTIKMSFFRAYLLCVEKVSSQNIFFFGLCQVLVRVSFVPKSSHIYRYAKVTEGKNEKILGLRGPNITHTHTHTHTHTLPVPKFKNPIICIEIVLIGSYFSEYNHN